MAITRSPPDVAFLPPRASASPLSGCAPGVWRRKHHRRLPRHRPALASPPRATIPKSAGGTLPPPSRAASRSDLARKCLTPGPKMREKKGGKGRKEGGKKEKKKEKAKWIRKDEAVTLSAGWAFRLLPSSGFKECGYFLKNRTLFFIMISVF